MSSHFAITPQDDDAVIRQRLLTRTTVTRGEPPLKRLIKKFSAFSSEVEKNADNISECERAYKTLLLELASFELPLAKTKAVINANLREQESFHNLQSELIHQINDAEKEIEQLKLQLEVARVERQHREEYEVIRRLIAAQPPRKETEASISKLEEELLALEAENIAGLETLELRKKQFSLLLHTVDELQDVLNEDNHKLKESGTEKESVQVMDVDEKENNPLMLTV